MKVSLNLIEIDTTIWLRSLEGYLDSSGQALERERETRLGDLRRQAAAGTIDWEEATIEEQEIDGQFGWSMPRLLTYSVVMMTYMVLEARLKALAGYVAERDGHRLGISDIAGSELDRAKTYFAKVIGVEIAADPAWQSFKDLAVLRHRLTHSCGVVARGGSGDRDFTAVLKRYSDRLTLSSDGELQIQPDLCREFIHAVAGFFDRLFTAVGIVPVELQLRQPPEGAEQP